MICELCQSDSGRYNMNLECCQIRYFANAPAHIQNAEYAAIVATEGKQAAVEWVEKVKARMADMKGLR